MIGVDMGDRAAVHKIVTQEFGSAGYNARRIARDQVSKPTGQLSHIRQTQAGVTRYRWTTAADERVRPSHQELDGTLQRWDSPTSEGFPGSSVQCRCWAEPVIGHAQHRDPPRTATAAGRRRSPLTTPSRRRKQVEQQTGSYAYASASRKNLPTEQTEPLMGPDDKRPDRDTSENRKIRGLPSAER